MDGSGVGGQSEIPSKAPLASCGAGGIVENPSLRIHRDLVESLRAVSCVRVCVKRVPGTPGSASRQSWHFTSPQMEQHLLPSPSGVLRGSSQPCSVYLKPHNAAH